MLFKRSILIVTLSVAAFSLSAGCSSKSNASKETSDKSTDSTSAKGCPGTDATIKITETGDNAKLTYAGGVSMSNGAAYTVYLSDSEIDASKISMTDVPEPVKGHHLATVFITTFNPEGTPPPIAEGTKIPFTPDFGVLTFRVMDSTGDESFNSAAEGKGIVTMTKVGETVCFSIDYTDDEKTMTGTVEAPTNSL